MPRIILCVSHAPAVIENILTHKISRHLPADMIFVYVHYKDDIVIIKHYLAAAPAHTLLSMFTHAEPQTSTNFLNQFREIRPQFLKRYLYIDANLSILGHHLVLPTIVPFVNGIQPDILGLFTRTPNCAQDARNLQLDNLCANSTIIFKFHPPIIDVIDIEQEKKPGFDPVFHHIQKNCFPIPIEKIKSENPASITPQALDALHSEQSFFPKEPSELAERNPDLETLANRFSHLTN